MGVIFHKSPKIIPDNFVINNSIKIIDRIEYVPIKLYNELKEYIFELKKI